ncbi:bone morphogenetic protein receptor type-2-like [Paramormyrops kingsleyae]|uniref:bone morphogenetic protein receptor type-2-like n=1 Tax=Paramormyrops kingsleyae TaxID=1676925 RepID=UPI003B96A0C5
MQPWKVILLFGQFRVGLSAPAEFKGRRCEFLTSPRNANVKWAGNVSGTVQYCASTRCCMGFYRIANGQAVPEQLGCDVFQTNCLDPTCHVFTRQENTVSCVCSSDFCNTNVTWNLESQPQHPPSLNESSTWVAVIVIGTLFIFSIFYVMIRYRSLFKDWARFGGGDREYYENPPSSLKGTVTPQCSCDQPAASDLDLTNLELQQVVASGHFASVWQGRLCGATVAVKVFPTAHRRSFLKEKEVFGLPLMEHPGLVHFMGAGMEPTGGHWVLLLELAKYGSLKNFLSSNSIDWLSSVKMAQTLSQGLAFLHTDLYRNELHKPAVAHGDLSSSNVLVQMDGTCALCDFGCATVFRSCSGQPRWQQQRESAQLRSQAGTLRYTSPEVLEGCVNLNNDRCLIQGDVYALGLLLWELWARCSDLYAESPVPEHQLPYEAELGPSPSLDELILSVSERRERPILPTPWRQFTQAFSAMKDIIEDCWDHEPDARLTAQCAADRVAALPKHCG